MLGGHLKVGERTKLQNVTWMQVFPATEHHRPAVFSGECTMVTLNQPPRCMSCPTSTWLHWGIPIQRIAQIVRLANNKNICGHYCISKISTSRTKINVTSIKHTVTNLLHTKLSFPEEKEYWFKYFNFDIKILWYYVPHIHSLPCTSTFRHTHTLTQTCPYTAMHVHKTFNRGFKIIMWTFSKINSNHNFILIL